LELEFRRVCDGENYRSESLPLHIVFSDNMADGERIIITTYEPDLARWTPDFTTRIKP
jgi:hypothetical protein